MNALAAILATAAVAAGSVRLVKTLRRKLSEQDQGQRNPNRRKKSGTSHIDLEKDKETGVYGLRKRG
ncbi:hypothetical protein HK107_01615 [Parvularcula sp. ZS-1/3]|uniref:Uncharacterized protein n=1 Tax=Parvularcula mediterranea TaxID=2732508 RepID=A0A7Y3W4B0_9PROT|nr:hypothetical protein [Parvularcula mediterranea]NNU15021.1 hypothetical protein [Parvularcula mediterranea]